MADLSDEQRAAFALLLGGGAGGGAALGGLGPRPGSPGFVAPSNTYWSGAPQSGLGAPSIGGGFSGMGAPPGFNAIPDPYAMTTAGAPATPAAPAASGLPSVGSLNLNDPTSIYSPNRYVGAGGGGPVPPGLTGSGFSK